MTTTAKKLTLKLNVDGASLPPGATLMMITPGTDAFIQLKPGAETEMVGKDGKPFKVTIHSVFINHLLALLTQAANHGQYYSMYGRAMGGDSRTILEDLEELHGKYDFREVYSLVQFAPMNPMPNMAAGTGPA